MKYLHEASRSNCGRKVGRKFETKSSHIFGHRIYEMVR
nr:MAG TPA: hypothetical protein [Caudoviricetes sp.]